MPATLDELSQVSGARLEGKSDCSIESVNTLKNAKKGEITFLSNRRYAKDLLSTKASAVILAEEDLEKWSSVAKQEIENGKSSADQVFKKFWRSFYSELQKIYDREIVNGNTTAYSFVRSKQLTTEVIENSLGLYETARDFSKSDD